MPINRNPKLRGQGLPGPFDPDLLSNIVDGTFAVWNATDGRWEAFTTPDEYADDATAAAGGVPVGGIYRTGSALKVRVS